MSFASARNRGRGSADKDKKKRPRERERRPNDTLVGGVRILYGIFCGTVKFGRIQF